VALKTWGSGPRGGMEGAKALAQHYGKNTLLTMDIGGTTTDVGVVDRGAVRERRWGALEDIQISFPLCEVESLGAGGSSVFRVANGKITVGPESVGGAPGPACFGYGGKEATITDAYLLLGILDGESYFGGSLKLDPARAQAAITENVAKPLGVSLDEALVKMEQAYTSKIADAMKALAPELKDAALLAFGGAGPMSACRVADALGIKEIIVPRMAAVFSAFGIGFSDIAHSYDAALDHNGDKGLGDVLQSLMERASRDMFAEGFDLSECTIEKTLTFSQNGEQATRRLNGDKSVPDGLKSAQDLRVQLRATKSIPHFALKPDDTKGGKTAQTKLSRKVRLSDGGKLTDANLPLFRHEDLQPGQGAAGPAVVEEEYFTCLIPAGWKFSVNDNLDLVLQKS
jgi:N-methylhydantoinase A